MRITGLRIRHYKSLGDVFIGNLHPITLLVGTNATGKSNLIDALRFLRDASTHSLDHAISSRGGMEVIRQYSPTRPYHISIRVEFVEYYARQPGYGYYEMTLGSASGGNYRVEREDALWNEVSRDTFDDDDKARPVITRTFTRNADGTVLLDQKETDQVAIDDLYITRRFEAVDLRAILGRPRFSAIYPNTLRAPTRPDTDRRLKETGENWASVLKAMRQSPRGRQSFDAIIEQMRVVMPNLIDVKVKGVGGYLVPQFVVKESEVTKEHSFDPIQLSDGTLRIFGILMGLYQIPPAQFLALEEPEQTIHPAILAMLADAFHEVSQRTQLMATTHSPYLIDYFEPEQIRVVTMEEGETQVLPVRKSQIESIKEKLTSLEELLGQGNLLPEST
jgi:predicted ATPase